MPIEREIKFVMVPGFDGSWFSGRTEVGFSGSGAIEQSYIGPGTRIRRITVGPSITNVFTYKKKTSAGPLVEIETNIDNNDYALLKADAIGSLKKSRSVYFHYSSHLSLEHDAFQHPETGEIILHMIEVEHTVGDEAKLDEIEAFLGDAVLARLPLDDTRFVNSNLTDPDKIAAALRSLETTTRDI